ncbi:gluconate 2-dehydrogenase subunit 3 family protein [Niabella hibiscisoli]|uniref:gluconate 2-dehydrogenase subunit 3 family protein n=1 Tax=Niabella hibiscisoli TaxID=1825928 RepID=UPI001F0FB871|nr:gluconate 2-dehydrogenase subunit 3 family protein [Niabella hibiscisoli]MCH5717296.1 gluconate 2-dehydrogenase subunit 3 family protein [Niabella hibiscisoli]
MNRREALASVSVLLGGAIIGAEVFLSGCKNTSTSASLFSADDLTLLDDIAETIIPTTPDSGGGKAALVGAFMKQIVTDCYTKIEQDHFIKGIVTFKIACKEQYQKAFTSLSVSEKEAFLTSLHQQAKEYKETEAYKKKKTCLTNNRRRGLRLRKLNITSAQAISNKTIHLITLQ